MSYCKRIAALLAVLAPILAGYGSAVLADPPRRLGELELVHAVQGKEALRQINRLHGKEVGTNEAYVAHYEKAGAVAMLYLAQAPSKAHAAGQVTQMIEGIRRGEGPFYHLREIRQGEVTLYSALGQGQVHYFYQRDADVLWLAVDAPAAKKALAALLGANDAPQVVKPSRE
jgi:hypothetical protein